MRLEASPADRSRAFAPGLRLKALSRLALLVLCVGLFQTACDEDNPPLLGTGGGGGGNGSQDSLVSAFNILSGDEQTGSTWNIFGEAVSGELSGKSMTSVVKVDHFWFSWAAFKPLTIIYQP